MSLYVCIRPLSTYRKHGGKSIMSHDDFTPQHRTIGRAAAWAIFSLGMLYLVPLVLGLLSLTAPQDPIGDPYFSMMELLILPIAPL